MKNIYLEYDVFSDGTIEITADFSRKDSIVRWRKVGDPDWIETPFTTKDFNRDPEWAVQRLPVWLETGK